MRYVDGSPVSRDVSYFHEATAEALHAHDLETRDIFCHPQKRSALPVSRAKLDIGATDACADTAHALETPMGSPIPRMDRLTFDRDGRPLDHEYLYCRGDQWRYRLRIERRGTRGGRAS